MKRLYKIWTGLYIMAALLLLCPASSTSNCVQPNEWMAHILFSTLRGK